MLSRAGRRSFEINAAVLSRSRVVVFHKLGRDAIVTVRGMGYRLETHES